MKIFVKLFTALNLGDDLFLKILLERYPDTGFYLTAPNHYKEIFKSYKNFFVLEDKLAKPTGLFYKVYKVLERNIFPSLYRKDIKTTAEKSIKTVSEENKYDGFVSIGGSIFMQPKKLPDYADVEYYKVIHNYFDKTFFLGCNFGPFSDPNYLKSYTEIFSNATDVCFREEASSKLFQELGNVRCKPDIVFGLDHPESEKKPKTVGFSIVSARNNIDEKGYIKKYAELVEFYQSKNYEIYFFSFCQKQGDEDVINAITDLLKSNKNINKVFYNGDIDSFLAVYSAVESMYCGRFHAMILSMVFNQNIFPVIYSKKMTNVLNDINYKGEVIKMEDFYKANPVILYDQITSNHYNIKNEKLTSKKQFEKLDLFLKQNQK